MTENLTNCPICNFSKCTIYPKNHGTFFVSCRRCGEFSITDQCIRYTDVKEKISKISYILSGLSRELYETKSKPPQFMTTNLEEYAKHYLVPDVNSIEEKIKKFLQRLREKTEYFGQEINFKDIETVFPLAYAKNSEELVALFTLMTEKKLAKSKVVPNGGAKIVKISLSANGWDITNSSQKENQESDKGFVAVWFDESMNESIKAIETAIEDCNFKPICIRDEHFSEKIMDKALGEIRKSRFVVVDLTGNRGSVFFEAGFAHGLGVETIYVFRESDEKEKSPLEFYARHYQCYKYKTPDDLREKLRDAISARIKTS